MSRSKHNRLTVALLMFVLACNESPSTTDEFASQGTWGAASAEISVTSTSASLHILADGGCYGSSATIPHAIPNGAFSLSGTYTVFTGVYPGHVDYPAQFTGTVNGDQMSVTFTVVGQTETHGPFALTRGVNHGWNACLYP